MDDTTEDEAVVTAWTGVYVTALVSFAQGVAFLGFFLWNRSKDAKKYQQDTDYAHKEKALDLYEARQHTVPHRSPTPFGSWFKEAWELSDAETLRCVGLDAYMFLRVLALGARITGFGSLISLALLPIYATGGRSGKDTEQFNLLTLSKVDEGDSWRMYVTVGVWYLFCIYILYEFWAEWKLYYKNRSDFMALGDADSPVENRYAIRVEQVQPSNNNDKDIHQYFERLFPGKVKQAVACLDTEPLEKLITERQVAIEKLEGVVAARHAKPHKPAPQVRIGGPCSDKIDAASHYETEVTRLNAEIDEVRGSMQEQANLLKADDNTEKSAAHTPSNPNMDDSIEVSASVLPKTAAANTKNDTSTGTGDNSAIATTTAFVTFTSLRAKQAAVQCNLTGDPDSMVALPAADPERSTLWPNVSVPLPRQKNLQFFVSFLWIAGIMFWAVPVSFVTSIANLNSMLQTLGLKPANPSAFWYGLVSGLLPVIALAILMAVLYMAIQYAATSVIRYKSWPEVDSYTLYWHMLFQFANLWLILLSGSLFNQFDSLLTREEGSSLQDTFTKIADTIAAAMPGASSFFVNMILVSSFGAFGLELSMLPAHGINMVMNCISPEASRTQRQLDAGKKPRSLMYGKIVPPVIFVFLVVFLYMAIVPILELFGLVYFCGHYIVYKHQCLHVYAPAFEGGGDATWQRVFGFLMACLYTAQVVFIAYMGLKKAPVAGGLGFIPLIVTVYFSRKLNRKFIAPLGNLSLESAAAVDIRDGELQHDATTDQTPAYRQPALRTDEEERGPMPYRRAEDGDEDDAFRKQQEGAV